MNPSATNVRRGLFGVFAGGLLAFGSAAIVAPVSNAQPETSPDCSAAGVAGTVSTAVAAEGAYLTANPQVNEALSGISAQPQEQAQTAYQAYLEENPQVRQALTDIYQPVGTVNTQCNLDLTPTPVAQAVWSFSSGAAESPAQTPPAEPTAPPTPVG